MSSIQPRVLNNTDLLRTARILFSFEDGLPIDWQVELMSRFEKVVDELPETAVEKDPRQLELF
jgi:hypothetical protein